MLILCGVSHICGWLGACACVHVCALVYARLQFDIFLTLLGPTDHCGYVSFMDIAEVFVGGFLDVDDEI